MTINEDIIERLNSFRIDPDDALCYLISLYHGYSPSYIPDSLKLKIHATGIYSTDGKENIWKVPLYEGGPKGFDWIKTEYVTLFKAVNPDKPVHLRECVKRIKDLFTAHPDIRKHELLAATKLYLESTDYRYVRLPHFFICKGRGATKTEDILTWIDMYRENMKDPLSNRNSATNTLQ